MKASFLHTDAPFVTEMVQARTAAQAQIKIQNAVANGATAIGVQLGCLNPEFRTDDTIKRIFSAAGNKPIYATNYRGGHSNAGKSDETLMNELLSAVDDGAALIDVMGDCFDPSPDEMTTDETAVRKQMELIKKVHGKGGEVLMSSHVRAFRNADRVLEIALEQERRGADIIKIVTGAETQEEEIINLDICRRLKAELKKPFLFLSGGKFCSLHRTIGPALGVCMWLCFSEYDESTYPGPPLLANVLKIKSALQL